MSLFPYQADHKGYQTIEQGCGRTTQVRLATGNLIQTIKILSIPMGSKPLEFYLTYNSQDTGAPGPIMGRNWRHNFQMYFQNHNNSVNEDFTLIDKDGRAYKYERVQYYTPGANTATGLASFFSFYSRDPKKSYYNNYRVWEEGAFIDGKLQPPEGVSTLFQDKDSLTTYLFNRHSGQLQKISYPHSSRNQIDIQRNSNGRITKVVSVHYNKNIKLNYSEVNGYTGDLLTEVVDPNGNSTLFEYDLNNRTLTKIISPEGCITEFTYGDTLGLDLRHQIQSITDAKGGTWNFSYDDFERLTGVTNPQQKSINYTYIDASADIEIGDDEKDSDNKPIQNTNTISATQMTDTANNLWSYHFDKDGNLWRTINPEKHEVHHYYDYNQKKLYTSSGYGWSYSLDTQNPKNSKTKPGAGDNTNNKVTRNVYNNKGRLEYSISPSGRVDKLTYTTFDKPKTITKGHAHLGIQGRWHEELGTLGYVLCAFNEDGSDVKKLPSFVQKVHWHNPDKEPQSKPVLKANNRQDFYSNRKVFASLGELGSNLPGGLQNSLGGWESSINGKDFVFRIKVNKKAKFNVSLYTHSADLEKEGGNSHAYYFGRNFTIRVNDKVYKRGESDQEFKVYNNGPGYWITFPVSAGPYTPVVIRCEDVHPNHTATISAIAFDAYEPRTVKFNYYQWDDVVPFSHPFEKRRGTIRDIIDPFGRKTSFTYNDKGDLKSTKDVLGRLTTNTYNQYGFLDSVTAPDGTQTHFEYDLNGNLIKSTNHLGAITEFDYDAKNRLVLTRDDQGNESSITYDANGNIVTTQDALGRITSMFYDSLNRLVRVEDPFYGASAPLLYSYDDHGNLIQTTDQKGNVTSLEYDSLNRLIQTNLPNGATQSQAYDVWNRIIALNPPNAHLTNPEDVNTLAGVNLAQNGDFSDPEKPTRNWSNLYYNGSTSSDSHSGDTSGVLNNTSSFQAQQLHEGVRALGSVFLKSKTGNSEDLNLSFRTYNFYGEKESSDPEAVSVSSSWEQQYLYPIQAPGDSQNYHGGLHAIDFDPSHSNRILADDLWLVPLGTAKEYDYENNLTRVQLQDGTSSHSKYDRFGRIKEAIDNKGNKIFYQYDEEGRLGFLEDSLGNTVSYSYDSAGRIISTKRSHSDESTVFKVDFEYDEMDRLTKRIFWGELISEPDPNTGEPVFTYDSQEENFVYDELGRLIQFTDRDDKVWQYGYDSLNRKTQQINPDDSVESWTYDAVGKVVSYIDGYGNQANYQYDDLDRKTKESCVKDNNLEWNFDYAYDANSNQTSLSTDIGSIGSSVYGVSKFGQGYYGQQGTNTNITSVWDAGSNGYDNLNRLASYNDGLGFQYSNSFDVNGNPTQHIFSDNQSTTISTCDSVYDIRNRLVQETVKNLSQNVLSQQSFGYNSLSQIAGANDQRNSKSFRYDNIGRLKEFSLNRLVTNSEEIFRLGTISPGAVDIDNSIKLLSFDDDFDGSGLQADRWKLKYYNDDGVMYPGMEVRQKNGLHIGYPLGAEHHIEYTAGMIDRLETNQDKGRLRAEHSQALPESFTLGINYEEFRGSQDSKFGFNLLDEQNNVIAFVKHKIDGIPSNTAPATHKVLTPNKDFKLSMFGTNWFLRDTDTNINYSVNRAGNKPLSAKKVTGGIELYFYDVLLETITTSYTGNLRLELELRCGTRSTGTVRVREVSLTTGDQYPLLGVYTSPMYDAGRAVDWQNLFFEANKPTGTDVKFQVAIGNDKDNLSFVGPDGTDQSYFTSNGDDLEDASNNALAGRYAKYKAFLSGDGAVTPELLNVEMSHSGDVASQLHQYAYDAQGNMLTKVVWDDASRAAAVAKLDESRTYNRLNQLTKNIIVDNGVSTTWDFTYDTAGNMISKTDGTDTYTYEWSYDDRLTAVKLNGTAQASYEYDSMGRMLKRTVGTNLTTFKWDGWNLIQEQSGGLETLYIAPEGEIVAVHVGANTYQLHADQVGSVHTITNSTGAVVGEQTLDPWGNRLQATGISLPCSGFVGKFGIREDSATGLVYMRNRWYSPELQRFISADPISIEGGLNLYLYAGADPVNNFDLIGLRPDLLPSHAGQINHDLAMIRHQVDPCNPFQVIDMGASIASGIIVAGASVIAAEALGIAIAAHGAGDYTAAYWAYIQATASAGAAVEEATGYVGPSITGTVHSLTNAVKQQAKGLGGPSINHPKIGETPVNSLTEVPYQAPLKRTRSTKFPAQSDPNSYMKHPGKKYAQTYGPKGYQATNISTNRQKHQDINFGNGKYHVSSPDHGPPWYEPTPQDIIDFFDLE